MAGLVREEVDSLRLWWALSGSVGRLAERIKRAPREIVGTIGDETILAQGEIPGIYDASDTVRVQAQSGDISLFVGTTPMPTWVSGPNKLVAHTLLEAERTILTASRLMAAGEFQEIAVQRCALLNEALRVSALREILLAPAGRTRLTPFERRQARKARAPIYRLATEAADMLSGLEMLEETAVTTLFTEGLLPALETWRKFELACIIECVSSLARVTQRRAILDMSFSALRPVATIGDLTVWWQRQIPARPDPALDTGESMVRELTRQFGATDAGGRADAVVARGHEIVAIIECKWFEAEGDPRNAIVDACNQIVRYARDEAYRRYSDPRRLIRKSLVAIARRDPVPLPPRESSVACVDLEDLEAGALDAWAAGVAA